MKYGTVYINNLDFNKLPMITFRPANQDFSRNPEDGKHILFAGCSFTWGDGLEIEDTWAYKTYKKIAETTKVDKYRNIGRSGFTISETINYIYHYIDEYGKPDTIFAFLPDPGRDLKYITEVNNGVSEDRAQALKIYVYTMYSMLDIFCRAAGIQLITSTWVADVQGCDRGLFPGTEKEIFYPGTRLKRPHWKEQMNNTAAPLFKEFESFHTFDTKEMEMRVFELDSQKKGQDKKYSLIAADDGAHPGTSFHDYWAEFMYKKWLEENA